MNAKSVPGYLWAHRIAAGFILACLLLPLAIRAPYFIRVLTEVFFFAAMGCAWNIIGGFGKQTSWASASFLAVGGYTSILMYMRLGGISPWLTIFVGMALSVALAVIIGLPCFRFRGVFFAIATIACVTIVRQLLIYFRSFTGGTLGLALDVRFHDSFADMAFLNDEPYYYLTLVWMLFVVLVTRWVERSRLGYYLKAMSEDQDAAESLGIRSNRMKLKAFIISSVILSATGTLYTFKMAYTDPNLIASFDISVRIGITAILGGMGTIWGPVLGSFICIPMLEVSNYYLADFGGGGAGYALYGLLIVLVVLFRPEGMISLYYNWESRRRAARLAAGEAAGAAKGGEA
ncbi:MAG: branched-chain amino acid ABC transporter permease [Planctomycetota bacterium]|jgi:branched-chain amino acid transport system permease protein|nr:branched-chain amino acid ABC transporter permease [Planctomycetota bacterium]